ncbi:Anthranilate phosphoribosyltransferase [Candidatus Vidania fulgoroideae]|nr:Anthranilate phosphoribosyltransferase [Candidatus Vidania fulgoroideae]
MTFLKKIKILNGRTTPKLFTKIFTFFRKSGNIKEKLEIIKKMSNKKNIINNIRNIHIFLRKNLKKIKKVNNEISLAGVGGDKKNTANITSITTIFLGLLNFRTTKINSNSYTSKVGSSNFLKMVFSKKIFKDKKTNCNIRKNLNCFFYNYNIILKKKILDFSKIRNLYGKTNLFNYAFSSFLPFKTEIFSLGTNNIKTLKFFKNIKFKSKKVIIFSSYKNIDEITLDKFKLLLKINGETKTFVFDPLRLGFKKKSGSIYIKRKKDSISSLMEMFKKKNKILLEVVLLNISIILFIKTGRNIRYIYNILRKIKLSFLKKKLDKIIDIVRC